MVCDNEIFEGKKVDFQNLIEYGFINKDDGYVFSTLLPSCGFIMTVLVSEEGKVHTQVKDKELEEEYILHLSPDSVGAFVGGVRSDYINILQDICDKCYESDIYSGKLTKSVIQYITDKYGDSIEYLWDNDPSGIWRRQDNRKWYGVLMFVKACKLGLSGDKIMQAIDLRCDPDELDKIADGKRYFRGYHMNKKRWLTVCLDGSVELEEIIARIDTSYELAADKKKRKK